MIRLFNGTININIRKYIKCPHRIVCTNGVVKYITKHIILTNIIFFVSFKHKHSGTYCFSDNVEIIVLASSKNSANSDGTSHLI